MTENDHITSALLTEVIIIIIIIIIREGALLSIPMITARAPSFSNASLS